MQFCVPNLFDSHVHWLGTGAIFERLQLKSIQYKNDLNKIKPTQQNFKGDWLLGWGFDENNFLDFQPQRQVLDEVFTLHPVIFTRCDGHTLWVNTEALKRAGLFSQHSDHRTIGVERDNHGWPTGVLKEDAAQLMYQVLPEPSPQQIRNQLSVGMYFFNQAGFTHIRDMSCSDVQWNESYKLAEQKDFSLAVIQNFGVDGIEQFESSFQLALRAKKDHHRLIRPGAVKVFFDGSLGSETALISQPYLSGSGRGQQRIERIALKEMLQRCWDHQIEFAVHTIGDAAADQVVKVANEIWDLGYSGRLHLEHVELLKDETILQMKDKNIVCHMQPSHWLSDKVWLENKIGDLSKSAFRWRDLEEYEIPFFFGSDSPVEEASFFTTKKAIEDAFEFGIQKPTRPIEFYHAFPDLSWTPNTKTEFVNGRASQVIFEGRQILNQS